MASTTRNLRLVLDDNLTATSRANLQKLDSLGAVFNLDNTQSAVIRSAQDIYFRPQDASIGGSGTGGNVTFGQAGQPIDTLQFNADTVSFSGGLGLVDQGSGGTKTLSLVYDSTLSGSIDTSADRTLKLDLNGSDRNLVLGGNLSLLSNSLSLTAPVSIAWTLPAGNGSSGQVLTSDGAGVLSWADVAGSYQSTSDTWTSGTSKTVTHNFGTYKVMVQVLDVNNGYANVEVENITRPTINTVQLDSSEAPGNWLVLLNVVS